MSKDLWSSTYERVYHEHSGDMSEEEMADLTDELVGRQEGRKVANTEEEW